MYLLAELLFPSQRTEKVLLGNSDLYHLLLTIQPRYPTGPSHQTEFITLAPKLAPASLLSSSVSQCLPLTRSPSQKRQGGSFISHPPLQS